MHGSGRWGLARQKAAEDLAVELHDRDEQIKAGLEDSLAYTRGELTLKTTVLAERENMDTTPTCESVRRELVDAVQIDLIGPRVGLGTPDEVLPQRPSSWYLTGFLVPLDADESQRGEETAGEEVDEVGDAAGADDATPPEPAAARRRSWRAGGVAAYAP